MTRIERAVPRDFLAIAALDRTAWQDHNQPEFIPDGEHVWRIWCEHALTYVARQEGRVVGAILAFPCNNGQYCLHKVMVDEKCRGRGIASDLFQALLKQVDGVGLELFLTVHPENEAALSLYAKWGFTERELIPGFYRETEDRYVLTRRVMAG